MALTHLHSGLCINGCLQIPELQECSVMLNFLSKYIFYLMQSHEPASDLRIKPLKKLNIGLKWRRKHQRRSPHHVARVCMCTNHKSSVYIFPLVNTYTPPCNFNLYWKYMNMGSNEMKIQLLFIHSGEFIFQPSEAKTHCHGRQGTSLSHRTEASTWKARWKFCCHLNNWVIRSKFKPHSKI